VPCRRHQPLLEYYGEQVQVDDFLLSLDEAEVAVAEAKELVHRPFVLVTRPTGSGKTTTLYTAIHAMNTMGKNTLTIEDPVEYQLELINQSQVCDAIGLSFARILRSVLRQDPDVISLRSAPQ
jgi:type II secretory ATPase GspE/PulE/Tfp pilus assembly ATPase PilB-like protein